MIGKDPARSRPAPRAGGRTTPRAGRRTAASLFESVVPRYPELAGRAALVTGASRGIGRGIAIRLAREGMRVVLTSRASDELEALARELRALGARAVAISADLGIRRDVARLFQRTIRELGTIDLLVNNAADLRRVPFFEVSERMFEEELALNAAAPFLCGQLAAGIMRKKGGGCIVNVSSVGGLRAHHPGLPYDATKGFLDAMTRSMGVELARYGIRVNAVAPGAIDTGPRAARRTKALAAFVRRIPKHRLGSPLEIAAAVAFLASDEAAYIAGQTLYVDGGITAQLSPPDSPL